MPLGEIDGYRRGFPRFPVRGRRQIQCLAWISVDGQGERANLLHFLTDLRIGVADHELIAAWRVDVDVGRQSVAREAESRKEPRSGIPDVIVCHVRSAGGEVFRLADDPDDTGRPLPRRSGDVLVARLEV